MPLPPVLAATLLWIGPPGAAEPRPAPQTPDAASRWIEVARQELAESKNREAVSHLMVALALRPAAPQVLSLLLEASADDADARTLWTIDFLAAAADARGRVKVEAADRERSAGDPWLAGLVQARVDAVRELVALADERTARGAKAPEELLVARWARRAACDLSRGIPVLEDALGAELDPRFELGASFHEPVIQALERQLASAIADRAPGDAMRLARVLAGLARQAGFEDLQGTPPSGMSKVAETAAQGLARARDLLAKTMGEPWSVEQLEWLTEEEGEAFTREHDSFAHPGIALSPRGWYRIETDCGYETLLGVARTVELHHERLANWYGRDPFVDRPGLVRVVPEAAGLESEGAPFWWAGGFQSGDVTTLRFSCGTIEGFGHGITHELTHRFDGALFPGQPAWLTEGKAVWTGSAFGRSDDEAFVANHGSIGTVEGVFVDGYGDAAKLAELIGGTLEDYRDNYSAGYALYLYLKTREIDGVCIFAERLQSFMRECGSTKRTPMDFFVERFCDGAQGRPAGFEAFSSAWATWIAGFYWKDRKPWTQIYTEAVPDAGAQGFVYDEPTWTWAHARAEPYFGDGQARLAGELLLELGRSKDAVRALVWALAVDGAEPALLSGLAAALESLGVKDAAWVARAELGFPDGIPAAPAPFAAALARTRAFADALAAAAEACAANDRPLAALALRAERARVAAWTGLRAPEIDVATLSTGGDLLHPFDAPAWHAGTGGWTEDGLTAYEDRRVAHLWYGDEWGDLHVGREKPRTGTGLTDRVAYQRDAFVRTEEYLLPGVYRLRARVQFTTSFVSGAVLIGSTRRDRNIRFGFGAGDVMFAIGESEEEPAFTSMGWSVSGQRERDGALPGSAAGGSFDFGRTQPAFELEILVDGPTARFSIDGKKVAIYHTADGASIEGHVGFATSFGAIRVQNPTLERLDRAATSGFRGFAPAGLELASARAPSFQDLQNRPFDGLPRCPNGTLVLWVAVPALDPGQTLDVDELIQRVESSARALGESCARDGVPEPIVVAAPALLAPEAKARLAEALARALDPAPTLLFHHLDGTAPEGELVPDLNKRWILFVDSSGIVRVAHPFLTNQIEFDANLRHWLRVFRDHGRPARALPPVPRYVEEETPPEDE